MHHAHVKDSESTLQFLVAFRVGEVAPSISGVNVTDLGSAKKLCSLHEPQEEESYKHVGIMFIS